MIRGATPQDAEAIVALWRVVFPEYADPARPQRDPRASVDRKLALGDGLFWLGRIDGAVIGTAMAGYDGHRGWLYSVGVHPRWRGRGCGRDLVAHALAALSAQGCPKVNLQVLAGNAVALAFWRACGFVQDDVVSLGRRLP
ncbi:MAG: GNAT family acetyltransferase [Betaproteobacteria bacterium]